MQRFSIVIPEYLTSVKVSNSRRSQFFKLGDKIPLKYSGSEYTYKQGKLYNSIEKSFIIKNSQSKSKPRYVAISGNALYARMHERIRIKIMNELKKSMLPHIPKEPLDKSLFPLKVKMLIYRTVDKGQWDIDNFNIFYFKAFFDLLRDKGVIPDDSIEFLTGVGSEFIPVIDDKDRKLEFIFERNDNLILNNHLLYNQYNPEAIILDANWKIQISMNLSTGGLMVDYDAKTYYIGIGKKHVIWNALNKVLISIAVNSLILNEPISISQQLSEVFGDIVNEVMSSHKIPVFINEDKNDELIINLLKTTKNSWKVTK